MIIYPAIDMRRGRCVRLLQGDAAAETVFADDPVDAARRWAGEGGQWLHLVNLDGALGEAAADNMAALARILAAVDIPVEFGGGVRTVDDIGRLLDAGVTRVILGSVAVREPEVVLDGIARYGAERVVVGIDARDGYVAVHGWLDTTEVRATDLAARMRAEGVRTIIYTDISRDGTLTGVNVDATVALARSSQARVIASGGVASLDDIRALKADEDAGIDGVIIGMALYRGAIELADAIRIAEKGQ